MEINRTINTATYTLLEELENKLDQASNITVNIDEAIEINNNLNTSITTANTLKIGLDADITTGTTVNTNLENTITTAKSNLNTSIITANTTKTALDTSNTNALTTKSALETDIATAQSSQFVSEIQNARNSEVSLDARLDKFNTDLSEKANKNWIINDNFDFWQRGITATNLGGYLADRFTVAGGAITGTAPTNIVHSRQQVSAGELLGSNYFYRINADSAGAPSANDLQVLSQSIENGVKKLCGLGKKVTISFYARSSIANKKLGVYIAQNYGSGGSPSVVEISNGKYFTLTAAWQKCSVTIDTIILSGKTFGTNNDDYLRLAFGYFWGSALASRFGDTVAESFGGSGYIDIAQVKLESGDKATSFVPRLITDEELLCRRYYNNIDYGFMYTYNTGSTNINRCFTSFPVSMRAIPTVTTTPYSGSSITTVESITKYGFSFGGTAANSIMKSYTADAEIY